ARALAGDPRVLLLDEPTEGVAPAIVEDIERQLIKLARERSLAVVVVEQDVDFLATVSDRILQMQKGRIVREVPVADLAETDIFAPVSQTNS
ncbi:MAG: ABC transporter ATP-binding protein, partial [Nitratireductor sp.]